MVCISRAVSAVCYVLRPRGHQEHIGRQIGADRRLNLRQRTSAKSSQEQHEAPYIMLRHQSEAFLTSGLLLRTVIRPEGIHYADSAPPSTGVWSPRRSSPSAPASRSLLIGRRWPSTTALATQSSVPRCHGGYAHQLCPGAELFICIASGAVEDRRRVYMPRLTSICDLRRPCSRDRLIEQLCRTGK